MVEGDTRVPHKTSVMSSTRGTDTKQSPEPLAATVSSGDRGKGYCASAIASGAADQRLELIVADEVYTFAGSLSP
jgi:hypothetical protein